MPILGTALTGAVAAVHGYILYLEMFLWTTPKGRKSFKLTPEFAEQSKVMAANQGLYNGFLAAGLAWGLLHPVPEFAQQIRLFFLGCVLVAGGYGGWSVGRKIVFVQAVPAAVSLLAVYFNL